MAGILDGRLLVRAGSQSAEPGQTFLLDKPLTTLGRAIDNDIVLTDERASRYHARIVYEQDVYVVEDLRSRNGTLLRGQRLTARQTLQQGDIISLPGLVLGFQTADAAETVVDHSLSALLVDEDSGRVLLRGEEIALTAKEYMAVRYLTRRAGNLVSKSELAEHVWPEYGGAVEDYNIEQLISRLRRKLEENPQKPQYLITVRGLGYRLITG